MEGPTSAVFTNLAARLLQNELGLDSLAIQLYPTNQYTPSVHRLLQLAANLTDAARNLGSSNGGITFPTVFRPSFAKMPQPDGTYAVFITGYEEVTHAEQILSPDVRWIDLTTGAAELSGNSREMIYGVPLVVAARKGFPNFNQFEMQTSIQVTRRLEFRRSTNSGPVTETNQMYLLSITNRFGVEAWNSYSNAFPNALEMRAAVEVFAWLTNEFGEILLDLRYPPTSSETVMQIPAGSWKGWDNPNYSAASFQLPLAPATNGFCLLPTSTYRHATRQFEPRTNLFEHDAGAPPFPVPQWYLNLRTRLRFMLIDTATGRLADYVNLDVTELPLDIISILVAPARCGSLSGGSMNNAWCTNRIFGGVERPPGGILMQIAASCGEIEVPVWPGFIYDRERAIWFFCAQFHPGSPSDGIPKTNLFYAPFTPQTTIQYLTRWEANDPLVHYTLGDLAKTFFLFASNRIQYTDSFPTNNLGVLNRSFEPWGGSPSGGSYSATVTDPGVKDPMVTRSDDWDFPAHGLDLGSLGRVHRGTPWQTVYLKSGTPQLSTWVRWLGYYSERPPRIPSTYPAKDWDLVDVLAPSLNTNPVVTLFSLNQPSPAHWAQVLDGMTVWTNHSLWNQQSLVMISNSAQCAVIATAIAQTRHSLPGERFTSIGQLLAVPELSCRSPWLSNSNSRSVTELACEAVPSQLLPLLRCDSIGTVAPGPTGLAAAFTGWDRAAYRLQMSSNLIDWLTVSTNSPSNGVFQYSMPLDNSSPRFFLRSELVP